MTRITEEMRRAFREVGRMGGRLGGPARARKLTKKQRIESARKAGKASAAARRRRAKEEA